MMIKAERFKKVISLVEEKQFVSVKDLMQKTGITKSTLRRDLFELESQGRVIRTRGGVASKDSVSSNNKTSNEPSFFIRQTTNKEEKERIAGAAMQFIHEGDTILIDAGTTTFELGLRIEEYDKNLMVATNDLFTSVEISKNDNLEIIVIGGKVRKNNYSTVGYFSDRIISEMHADVAFLSADAVDLKHGLMAYSLDEVTGKKGMIESAREVVLLCDHTKFSTIAFVTICSIADVDHIITGSELDPEVVSILREKGVDVILV